MREEVVLVGRQCIWACCGRSNGSTASGSLNSLRLLVFHYSMSRVDRQSVVTLLFAAAHSD